MGARPTQFKKSGGFLNGIDGVITDYTFTDEFDGEAFKPGRNAVTKKEKFHSLNVLLTVRPDGADEDVSTTLFAGGFDDFKISDDGKTIWDAQYETQEEADAATDARQLGANTAIATLISSLVDAGFPITNLSDAQSTNFEPIIGSRVRFVQRVNAEATKKLGKRKSKDGKKEYDRQDLVIDQVYSVGDGTVAETEPVKPTKGGKPAPATKPVAGKKGKTEPAVEDIKDLSATTLVSILSDNDGQIAKSKVSMKVLTALMKHPQREDVRKWLFDDENLASLVEDGVITYNKAKQMIASA